MDITLFRKDHVLQQVFSSFKNDALPHCRTQFLGPPSLHFCLLRNSFKLAPLTVLSTLLLLLLSLPCFPRQTRPTKRKQQDTAHKALQALLTVVNPTRSLWSSVYLSAARRAVRNKGYDSIDVPLQILLDDLIRGHTELRNPRLNLPALMKGDLEVHDFDIRLCFGSALWMSMLCQIISAHLLILVPYQQSWLNAARVTGRHPSTAALKSSCAVSQLNFGSVNVLTLDAIPYPHLENCIRDLQSSLASGEALKILLTTRSAMVPLSSKRFVMAAIPFLQQTKFGRSTAPAPERRVSSRTTTPLQASLSQVLELLTSGRVPFTVGSVQNVSEEYAAGLTKYVEDLEEDAGVRSAFVAGWGLDVWREERLLATWEAGLLSAGLLQEWSIVVRK